MDCINNQKLHTLEEDSFLNIVYGDASLGIFGGKDKKFQCIFSYVTGGLESLVVQGREWLYRIPTPVFWRATTENDKGTGFPQKSGVWIAATMFSRCINISVAIDGKENKAVLGPQNNIYHGEETAQEAEIRYLYETTTNPATTVEVCYRVKKTGVIEVNVRYTGKEELPPFPVFGIRFIMPTCADRFQYEGLSGETYPDRKAGGQPGVYEIQGLPVTPYLVPQDCGMHMDSDWVEIYRSSSLDNSCHNNEEAVLRFEMDKLAFSCLPFTAEELENATHQEELPVPRRTVLCIYGAVRGVGGINSWGADVESAYRLQADEDMEFSFRIQMVR